MEGIKENVLSGYPAERNFGAMPEQLGFPVVWHGQSKTPRLRSPGFVGGSSIARLNVRSCYRSSCTGGQGASTRINNAQVLAEVPVGDDGMAEYAVVEAVIHGHGSAAELLLDAGRHTIESLHDLLVGALGCEVMALMMEA